MVIRGTAPSGIKLLDFCGLYTKDSRRLSGKLVIMCMNPLGRRAISQKWFWPPGGILCKQQKFSIKKASKSGPVKFDVSVYSCNNATIRTGQTVRKPKVTLSGSKPPAGGEMEVFMANRDQEYCVYKASPSGIQRPLYYGSEADCRKFCERKDYTYIDEQQVVWYLEIGSCKQEHEIKIAANTPISA